MSKYRSMIDAMEEAKIPAEQILTAIKNMEPATRKTTKPARKEYTESFENFWRAYYVSFGTKGQKKPLAFKAWQNIDEEGRSAALASLPQYKSHLNKTEYAYQHVSTYLNGRTWESFETPVLALVAKDILELLPFNPEHAFLMHCRNDHSSEGDISDWSQGRFVMETGGSEKGLCVIAKGRGIGDFDKAFGATVKRLKYSMCTREQFERRIG